MSTIKELLQEFCYRVNLPAPTSFVGVSSPAEQQYLSLFRFIGDNLLNRPYPWPQLKRGYTFTTETDVRRYELPGDFFRLLETNQWDSTNQWPMIGPVSDASMLNRQYNVVGLQTRKVYRIIGPTGYIHALSPTQKSAGSFEIDPAGANNTDELFMGYISRNWIWPRDWVTATAYTAGDIRSGDGYVYRATNSATSGATRPSHATGSTADGVGGVTWAVYREPYICGPANSALNDSDYCLFDDDLMIEGMRWAYLRSKKLDYQQERTDWEEMVKSAYARFNGPVRISMVGPEEDDEDYPMIPQGSWNV